jgi:cyclopropane-fatty-acyl-phospholipid synthase
MASVAIATTNTLHQLPDPEIASRIRLRRYVGRHQRGPAKKECSMPVANLVAGILGDAPVAVDAYDHSTAGPSDAATKLVLRSPDAVTRVLRRPGELGVARALVAGDLDLDGDLYSLLEQLAAHSSLRIEPMMIAGLVRSLGTAAFRRLPPPPEEARLRGRLHPTARDAAAMSHHHDASVNFH